MKYFCETYYLFIKMFFKSRSQYKFSFFMGIVANFYCYFVTYLTYWVLIQGIGSVGGWDFYDLSILYGLSLLSYSICATLMWYTVYNLEGIIQRGELDIFLVRPQKILNQLIWQRFGETAIGQIIVTLIFLTVAFVQKSTHFSLIKVLYLVLALCGGVMIQCSGMILIGAFSFWTVKSKEIGNILYYDIRDMTKYPLIVFPKWIQIVLTFIFPWAFINYYPSIILLDKKSNNIELLLGLLVPIVGIIFLKIALNIFQKGVEHYSGTGN